MRGRVDGKIKSDEISFFFFSWGLKLGGPWHHSIGFRVVDVFQVVIT